MNLPMLSTVAGDLATMWRRIVAMTIETTIQLVEVAAHLSELTDPHPLPIRRRLFRRSRVLAVRVPVALILVARIHISSARQRSRLSVLGVFESSESFMIQGTSW